MQEKEPTEIGADIIVRFINEKSRSRYCCIRCLYSWKEKLIELCAERLTSPGIGKEIGPSLNQNSLFIKGLFFAPSVVASSVKDSNFCELPIREKIRL